MQKYEQPQSKGPLIKVSRNTAITGIASFLVDLSSEMIFPLLPFFITVLLGAPAAAVSLMEGLGEFATAVASPISGLYSDKTGRRKKTALFGYSLSAFFKGFLIIATTWPQVAFLKIVERAGKGIRESPRDALIVLSEEKSNLETAFGFRKFMDNTGAILGPLVAAAVIALFFNNSHNIESYRFLFTIALVPAILGVIVLLFLQEKHLVKEPVTINILKLSQNNKAMRFTALMAFLALGQFSIMMVLIWAGNYLELIYIPILYLAYNASYATFSLTASKIVRFIEAKRVILLGMLVFAASMILLSFSYSGVSLLLSVLLIGLAMAIFETVAPAYLMKKTEEGSYATTMGFYRAVVGIVALPGNLIAGLLWGTMLFGLHAPFLFSAAVAIAAFMLATLTINGSGKH